MSRAWHVTFHNGAEFFSHEFGGAFGLNKLEYVVEDSKYCPWKDFYSIGSYCDLGQVLINSNRVSEGRKDYMFVSSDTLIDLKCDFISWLDRSIMTNGEPYWEWGSTEVDSDTLEPI